MDEKRSVIERILSKLDGKLEEKSKKSGCCCCDKKSDVESKDEGCCG